jgi:hypothetical protein
MKRFALFAFALVFAAPMLARADDTRRVVVTRALMDKADLDAAAANRVEEVNDRFRPELRELRRERVRIARELRGQLRLGAKEARLKTLDNELLDNTARLEAAHGQRMRELAKVLTPSQFGRLLMSWRAIQRSVRRGA